MFNTKTYLDRLRYTGALAPNIETLHALHGAHLMKIPYENLSIMAGQPFSLDEDVLFEKLVLQRRGGFCYELNISFVRLLRELGFRVDLLSARLFKADGSIGPNFDHATLVVYLDEPWLADVGNSRWFHSPLRLNDTASTIQDHCCYRISQIKNVFVLYQISPDKSEYPQYLFTLTPQQGSDFIPICHYKWVSPYSKFTAGRMCSRITNEGRITLTETSLIAITNGQRDELALHGETDFARLLHDCFDLDEI
jgi:N-hydroxyarylamine O-acetyltransferase